MRKLKNITNEPGSWKLLSWKLFAKGKVVRKPGAPYQGSNPATIDYKAVRIASTPCKSPCVECPKKMVDEGFSYTILNLMTRY